MTCKKEPEMDSQEEAQLAEPEMIAQRIRHILTYFPALSHSMLQVALGPKLPANLWRPILQEMIAEQEVEVKVVSTITPLGRSQTYHLISLQQ